MTYTLGIELGSTRIKSVLINENHELVASGSFAWENRLENGIWTYRLDEVWEGIRGSYAALFADAKSKGIKPSQIGGIGVSAMMHGYLVFDKNKEQLVPFRTWRNTCTEEAANHLTKEFKFNIPQRWSIAHLYQAMLNKEDHVKDISFMTTLAGYVHWQLTGEKIAGVGEASGMFPVLENEYRSDLLKKFDTFANDYPWNIKDIMPDVYPAGKAAGALTAKGAKLLDPTGELSPGILLCPPEGDAGTGMVATNSILECTGNVSAGTSIFAMIVLEKELSKVYPQIDIVTTPAGKPVAMVHCNNCSSDLDAWVKLFSEISALDVDALYSFLFKKALDGEPDCAGLVNCNYVSGEHTTGFEEGRPFVLRTPDNKFSVANLMRSLLYSTMTSLKLGMDILTEKEHVRINKLMAHGGLFNEKGVVQKLMAGVFNVPVAVMASAAQGGAWGMALLVGFMLWKEKEESLETYLEKKVFHRYVSEAIEPDKQDVAGFETYMKRYNKALIVERCAVDNVK